MATNQGARRRQGERPSRGSGGGASSATVPAGASFVTLDADGQSLPSDWYLRLGGAGAKMLRGELPLSPTIPISP